MKKRDIFYLFGGIVVSLVFLLSITAASAGVVLVKDINPAGDSSPYVLVEVDGALSFTTDDGTNATELWAVERPEGQPLLFGGSGDGGGCFIITAAYGSHMAKEVKVFQRLRDEYLLTNGLGRIFVSGYYKYSPPLANWIAENPLMRQIVRVGLYPILELSKWFVGENPPE